MPSHDEPDIRVRVGFFKHPKTVKLRRRLGGDGPLSLLALWAFARVNRLDGSLDGLSDEDIEIAAGWDGQPGALCAALVEIRWLDGGEGARLLHGWDSHQGWAMALVSMSAAGKASAEARKAKYGTAQPSKVVREPSTNPRRLFGETPEGCSDVRPNPLPSALPKPSPEEQKAPSEPAAPKPRRKPTDPLILSLKNRLGSGTKPCADQIRALRGEGWTDERLAAAIEAHAKASVSPWEWTRRAKGMTGGNGKLSPDDALNFGRMLDERSRGLGGRDVPVSGLPQLPPGFANGGRVG